MIKQQVLRQTLNGNWTAFEFPNKSSRYFVKNYSSTDVLVSFEENDEDKYSFLIKPGMGEECAISWYYDGDGCIVNTIYVKGTGVVEVQQLDWRN